MKWSYGVTTVPERMLDLLPRTLESLATGGFDRPWLFVDDHRALLPDPKRLDRYRETFASLNTVVRQPGFNTIGNWILSAWELYLREPQAHRYAIFQDDLVTYRNLRQYLERVPYPDKGYLNLYTFPRNQRLAPEGHTGFYKSDQMGKGAVALIFNRDALTTLLSSPTLVLKPQAAHKPDRSMDGCIVNALKNAGYTEYVHSPSLVQHTGLKSSMGNGPHRLAPNFLGEDWDAMDLLLNPRTDLEEK